MSIQTQQEFDAIMLDPATDINTTIEFPSGTVDWKLNITKPCTIFGNNTTIDVSSLGYDVAVTISAGVDISDLTVLNSEKTAIYINAVQDARFEKVRAGHSQSGWIIEDSFNNEFEECESYNNTTGVELRGSSNIVGGIDSYQELGLSGLNGEDPSGLLSGKDYYFKVSGKEYKLTTSSYLSINNLVQYMNNAKRTTDGQVLKADYLTTLTGGDIRISSLTNASILIERGTSGSDLFSYINGFDTKETIEIITQPDTAFSLQSKYFFFNTPTSQYYVWYNVSNGGVNPADPGMPLEGSTKLELAVNIDENDSDEVVAQKTYDVLVTTITVNEITITHNLNSITISSIPGGNITNTQDVNTGFTFNISDGALDGVFDTPYGQVLENERTDRCHNNEFFSWLIHDNNIGIKLANANHNKFTNCQTYQNTNIGVWQADISYSNEYNGEVYGNIKYGVRNTDRIHTIDVTQTWWGDQTGPSGGGRGEGDKVSNYVKFDPWLQSGTEPDLSYPVTRAWIWSMLGYPQVAVELTEDQITNCITIALDKFHYYWTPEPYYWYSGLAHGQNEIELPPEIPKQSVIEVSYAPQSDIFSQLSGAGESFFLTYYMQKTNGTFLTDFYIAMSYKETFERILGIMPSYEFVTHPDSNGIMKDYVRLYPSPSSDSIRVGLKVSRTLSEYETDQQMWIRRYALTWAKENLGQIRSKFSSVPGPTGEVTLKGDGLIQEALQEREFLLGDIIKRSEPLGFTTG